MTTETTNVTGECLAALLEASNEARTQTLTLTDLMESSQLESANEMTNEPREATETNHIANVARQQKLLTASLAKLRRLHRAANFAARETKAQTAEARQEVDRLHLQLQNLYYEQRHLQEEISACENYDHSYKQLPLIPQDEFLTLFPEHTGADESALMSARIAHEKQEREALEQQKTELMKKKLKLDAENKKRKEDLANLDRDLESFIDAAKPIQKLFEKVV